MARQILVVYYSMTGHTRRIAEEVVATLNADCEEIREPHPRHGVGGVIRAMFDSITGREPPIEPPQHNPNDYDLLVLGGPVWVPSTRPRLLVICVPSLGEVRVRVSGAAPWTVFL